MFRYRTFVSIPLLNAWTVRRENEYKGGGRLVGAVTPFVVMKRTLCVWVCCAVRGAAETYQVTLKASGWWHWVHRQYDL